MATPIPESPMLLRHDQDGVATLTLNRPQAQNALSLAMMGALLAELLAAERDQAVRVIVIDANGRNFCAGHDLRELRANRDAAVYRQVFETCSRLMTAITTIPKPVIAAVQGVATAAGCQLVASCDLAIAADSARFATPGVNIGLFCSTPMVALSRAVSRKAAMAMLLTGDMIDAGEAERIGLINRTVPQAQLPAAAQSLAAHIARRSQVAIAFGKPAFHHQADMPLAQAYAMTSEIMTRNMLTEEADEGIEAFLTRRAPAWPGR